jgi:hypothetical protein
MGLMSMGLLGLIHALLQRLGLGLRSLGLRSLRKFRGLELNLALLDLYNA